MADLVMEMDGAFPQTSVPPIFKISRKESVHLWIQFLIHTRC